jgi:hypothetical protein
MTGIASSLPNYPFLLAMLHSPQGHEGILVTGARRAGPQVNRWRVGPARSILAGADRAAAGRSSPCFRRRAQKQMNIRAFASSKCVGPHTKQLNSISFQVGRVFCRDNPGEMQNGYASDFLVKYRKVSIGQWENEQGTMPSRRIMMVIEPERILYHLTYYWPMLGGGRPTKNTPTCSGWSRIR